MIAEPQRRGGLTLPSGEYTLRFLARENLNGKMGTFETKFTVPDVNAELKFPGPVLADIFLGNIKKWNDPKLAKDNPGVKFPDAEIVVVHRSDGSGTSYIWTDYLSKVSHEWQQKVGKATSVNWPVGLGGKGNEGVSALIQQTPASLGYIELIYAIQNKLPYGKVKNSSGAFVKADLASVSAAAAAAAKFMPDDFRVSITNPEGKAAYPIASFTWLLIPAKFTDAAKRDVVKDFLKWMMTDEQQSCEALSYAKLPKEVVAKEMKAIAQIQ